VGNPSETSKGVQKEKKLGKVKFILPGGAGGKGVRKTKRSAPWQRQPGPSLLPPGGKGNTRTEPRGEIMPTMLVGG